MKGSVMRRREFVKFVGGIAGMGLWSSHGLGQRQDERPNIVLIIADDMAWEIEREVLERGGKVEETEVIGMIPDTLVLPGTADRLQLSDLGTARVLSRRVADHIASRSAGRPETSDTAE